MSVQLVGFRANDPRLGPILRPATPFDEAVLREAPFQRVVSITLDWNPAPKAPRWYRALLRKLTEAGVYQNTDEAHWDVMLRTRRVDSMVVVQTSDRIETKFWPVSTLGWDGPAWRSFLADAIEVVIRDLVPNIPIGKLRAEIERQIGIRLKEALEEQT
jgi:hypothetical protein